MKDYEKDQMRGEEGSVGMFNQATRNERVEEVKCLLHVNISKYLDTNTIMMVHLDFLECSSSFMADKEGVIGRIFSRRSASFLNSVLCLLTYSLN